MSNAITCIQQKFAFKNSGISCLALIFNLSNLSGSWLRDMTSHLIGMSLWFSGYGESWQVWRHGINSRRVLKVSAVTWPF